MQKKKNSKKYSLKKHTIQFTVNQSDKFEIIKFLIHYKTSLIITLFNYSILYKCSFFLTFLYNFKYFKGFKQKIHNKPVCYI